MKPLRILVFSAGFGNGHFRAAEAVIEGLRVKAPDAEITHLDFGEFLSKRVNSMVKNVYLEMTKHTPGIWKKLYSVTDKLEPESRIQRFLKQLGRRDFLRYIQAFAPDLIVCTYPTISSILAQLRLEQLLQVPVITVITDYTLHSHWVHPGVDQYLAACEEVKASLVSWGIKASRVLVTGIPVSPKFDLEMERGPIISRLGLRPDIPTFLVMGGAYAGSSVTGICKTLANSPEPVQTIVVCGKNTRLYHSLGEVSEESRHLLVRLGYVHYVEELMSVSDLIITKAGGLTVSEALTKHLPLVIYKAIPGQEEENARFVESLGAGRVAGTEEELRWILKCFLSQPKEMEKIRAKAAVALPGHSTERAVEAMLQLRMNRRNEQKIG